MKYPPFAVFPCLALAICATPLFANPPTQTDLKAAQAALNKEVLARPFSVEDYQSVEVYIQDRHTRGLRPVANWRTQDDCDALTSIAEYRDCQYYKRYYAD